MKLRKDGMPKRSGGKRNNAGRKNAGTGVLPLRFKLKDINTSEKRMRIRSAVKSYLKSMNESNDDGC